MTTMRWVAPVLVALLSGASAAAADGELAWHGNLGDGLKLASAAGKPVLVDVWAVWCVPCKQMDQTTYRDAAVKAQAEGFVLVKVDADVQVPVIQRYEIEAYPTTLFLDGKGSEITRFAGYRNAADLAGRMKSVSEGYVEYQKARGGGAPEILAGYFMRAGNAAAAVEQYKSALKKTGGDAKRREALELDLAASQQQAGQDKAAAATYERLSTEAQDEGCRRTALQALIRLEIAMGKRKDAEASLARLAKEFPDLVPGYEELVRDTFSPSGATH